MTEEKDLEVRILSEARAQLMEASPDKIRYTFVGRDDDDYEVNEYYSINFNGYRFQVTQRCGSGLGSVWHWYTLDVYKGNMEVVSRRLPRLIELFDDVKERYARKDKIHHARQLLAAIEKSKTGGRKTK